MAREDYLEQLQARLAGRMSPQELKNTMAYYNEYFDEAGSNRAEEVITELGTPAHLARLIMGDKVLELLEEPRAERSACPPSGAPTKSPRRGLGVLWTVLLALCAAPIAIPLIVAVVALVVALVVAILALGIGLSVGGLACIAAGIFAALCGFSVLFSAGMTTTMFFVGMGLLVAGLGLLIMAGMFVLTGVCFQGLARLVGRIIHKRRRTA